MDRVSFIMSSISSVLTGLVKAWLFASYLRGEQMHIMCAMEELMPSIGTTVPSPLVLAVAVSQSDHTLQDICRLCPDVDSFDTDFNNPFDSYDESHIFSKTRLISISDDGKVWKWLLTAEGSRDGRKHTENVKRVSEVREVESHSEAFSGNERSVDKVIQLDDTNRRGTPPSGPSIVSDEVLFKVGDLVIFIF